MKIFDETLTQTERALDVRLLRHSVLAGNVANVDTPGYRPKEVDFSTAMQVAMEGGGDLQRTDGQHLDVGGMGGGTGLARVVKTAGSSPSLDGNAVDLDKTMTSMAENALQYSASARGASKKLALLRYVASDGQG